MAGITPFPAHPRRNGLKTAPAPLLSLPALVREKDKEARMPKLKLVSMVKAAG
jgi:hypothetical protein